MTEKKATLKRIAKIAAEIILALVVLVNLLTVVLSSAGLRTQLNWMPFACLSVTSGSMEPDFSAGDMIIVKDVPYEEIEPGDIITYSDSEGGFTTHRLIRRDGNNLITKGTANAYEDDPVNIGSYCAKMVAVVPGFGRVLDLMSQPLISAIALAAVALLFFIIPALARLLSRKADEPVKPKKSSALRNLAALALASLFAITPFMTAARYRAKVYDYRAATAAYVCFTSNYLGSLDKNYSFRNSGWDGKGSYTFPLEIRNYTNRLRYNDTVDVPYVLYVEKLSSNDNTNIISPDKYTVEITTSVTPVTDKDKTTYHVDTVGNNWSDSSNIYGNLYGPYLLAKSKDAVSFDAFTIVVKINDDCPVISKGDTLPVKESGEEYTDDEVIYCGQELNFAVMACTDQNTNYYQELKGEFKIEIAEDTEFLKYTITDNAESGDADSFIKLVLETSDLGDGTDKPVYIYWDAQKMYFNEADSYGLNVLRNKTLYYSGKGTAPDGCTEGIGKIVIPVGTDYWAQMNFIKFSQYSTTDLSSYVYVTTDSTKTVTALPYQENT